MVLPTLTVYCLLHMFYTLRSDCHMHHNGILPKVSLNARCILTSIACSMCTVSDVIQQNALNKLCGGLHTDCQALSGHIIHSLEKTAFSF